MRLRLPALLFLLVVLLSPFSAFAQSGGTMFDPIIPDECKCESVPVIGGEQGETAPSAPNWGCVLKVLQNVINTAVGIAILVVVLAIVYAAFLFMTRGGSSEARSQARNVIGSSLLGLAILLGAWLGVDFVMKVAYNPNALITGNTKIGPWNAIWAPSGDDMCIAVVKPEPIATGVVGLIGDVLTGGGGTGGSCVVPSGGPCAVAALQATFGAAAREAAQICAAESGGNPQNLSRTDRTDDGYAYSVGLFQINLTNSFNARVNGRNCSEAFTHACQGSAVQQSGRGVGLCSARIKDMTLYNQCVRAAQRPDINIAAARTLYDGDWGRWSTARKCNLPR